MKSKRAAIKEIKAAVANGTELVGCQVFWTVRDVRVTVGELARLYDKHGLGEEWFPPKIREQTAFRKALRGAKKGATIKGRGKKQKVLVRGIVNTDDGIAVGIVDEHVDEEKVNLAHQTDTTVTFDKDTKRLQVEGSHRVTGRLRSLYSELTGTYISADIQSTLVRNVSEKMRAVCLRSAGGVYYVPAGALETLERHKAVVEELSPDCEFTIVEVFGTDKNKRNLGGIVRRTMLDEVAAIKEEITEFKKAGNKRKDTLLRRVQEFQALKNRADLHARMLSIDAADIVQGIADAEKVVNRMIGVKEKEERKKEKDKKARRMRRTKG